MLSLCECMRAGGYPAGKSRAVADRCETSSVLVPGSLPVADPSHPSGQFLEGIRIERTDRKRL